MRGTYETLTRSSQHQKLLLNNLRKLEGKSISGICVNPMLYVQCTKELSETHKRWGYCRSQKWHEQTCFLEISQSRRTVIKQRWKNSCSNRACSGLQTCPQAIAQKHSTFINANCMDSNANEHSDTVDTEKGPSGETVNRTRPRAAIDGEVIRWLRN